MTRWSLPLIGAAFGLGFVLGVLAAARLDRRAAFRQWHSDEWIEANSDSLEDVLAEVDPAIVNRFAGPIEWRDERGWTASDHEGLEHDLVWRP